MKVSIFSTSLIMVSLGLACATGASNVNEVDVQLSEMELGAKRYSEKRYDEAIELLLSARRRDPLLRDSFNKTGSPYVLGVAYIATNQFDKAEPVLKDFMNRQVERYGFGDEQAMRCRDSLLNMYQRQGRRADIVNLMTDEQWVRYSEANKDKLEREALEHHSQLWSGGRNGAARSK
ncbi:hypothetical protein KF707_21835 [Candidatus Obscuribacterales bacterium]|nr:hypothetical protein [Candidatus Obscuribacterales bacterium]MBX3138883.1 hypothetical protein [Candidatus Obscuribacterales bacterium]MBX3152215.1 hypothetical protein [Candidatus Obscuribacterales bacterium]